MSENEEQERAAHEGYCKGESCNRDNCKGIIDEHEKDGCCSCHVNPPCGYCTEPNSYCETCGWDAREEQDEYDKIQVASVNTDFWEQQRKEWDEAEKLFYKMWRGEVPADKLIIRNESHTHFSMKLKGVFPKGSETTSRLLPKVRGTFGGRFETSIDENSYRFEYIAYTD